MSTETRTVDIREVVESLRQIATRMSADQSGAAADWAEDVKHVADRLSQAGVVWTPPAGGPRVWSLPAAPGSEVMAVRDQSGDLWEPADDGCWLWAGDDGATYAHLEWIALLDRGPLTDATGVAS